MSKILVTGGCGFIGSILVPKLQKLGHEVGVLDSLVYGNLDYCSDISYDFFNVDIRDESAVKASLKGYSIIIHLAAFGSVINSIENPKQNFEVNTLGTLNLLNASINEDVEKFVFASTGGALIGNASPPVNEFSIPRPISPYGASKLACEGYCCAFANSFQLPVTSLRFANVIGPNSWHKKGAVTAFYKSIIFDKPINIYGDGMATRDFLFVEDLCEGIISAIQASLNGFNVYHLSSGREVSIGELAKIACDVSGVSQHEINFQKSRIGEVERNFADFNLAKNDLGFNPTTSLENSMQLTWDWFKSYAKKNNQLQFTNL